MSRHEPVQSFESPGSEADSKKYSRIVLSKDTGLQMSLQKMSNEYDKRLAYQAPEENPFETYKNDILRALLENESVDEEEIVRKEQKRGPDWFNEDAFHEAFEAISRYNRDSGKGNRGDTRLSAM